MRTLLIAFGVVALLYAIVVLALLVAGRTSAAREVAMLLPNLAILFKGLIQDPRTRRVPSLKVRTNRSTVSPAAPNRVCFA